MVNTDQICVQRKDERPRDKLQFQRSLPRRDGPVVLKQQLDTQRENEGEKGS